MAHAIEIEPNNFKKGDRVQHMRSGQFATVAEDQNKEPFVKVIWDKNPSGYAESYMAEAFQIALWHEIHIRDFAAAGLLSIDIDTILTNYGSAVKDAGPPRYKTFEEVRANLKQYGSAVKANPASVTPIHKIGDRVKLKYNRNCGTVKANSFPGDTTVPVEWDKAPGVKAIEKLDDLVVLYAPRDTDPVNPNQEAIDAIEVQRQALIKEVEAVQARLRNLTTAKKLLERG